MTLAERVKDFRYAKGWGPDELASRAEISRTALYQIESGKTELPRAGTLRRIAAALDVSIDALLGRGQSGAMHLPSFAQGATAPVPTTTPVRYPEWMMAGFSRPGDPYAATMSEAPQLPGGQESGQLGMLTLPPRERDLTRKLHELLASPLGEGVARIVEESHRLLPLRSVQTG
jgi:transcriptional regulator with XRE-family HTH domain